MNLLDDLKAPLFAELDVSNVRNYIDTKIDTRLDHINDTLDDKIEALIDNKMTVDNLDKTKLNNDERVSGFISDLKSLEEIVKNITNENNQLKEDFTEWKKHGKWYCRLYNIVYY
jgi:predicted  nucleic acid-binding Zn-ribbon protein